MINEHSFQAEGLSDKHKLLFAQRKAEFLQDFGEDVAALDAAEKEVRLLSIRMIRVFNGWKFSLYPDQVEKMLKKMEYCFFHHSFWRMRNKDEGDHDLDVMSLSHSNEY